MMMFVIGATFTVLLICAAVAGVVATYVGCKSMLKSLNRPEKTSRY